MLVVGLGNPGETYKDTVHNMGFMAVDCLLARLGLKLKDKSCKALSVNYFCGGQKHVIAEPQTFMNLSGESVRELVGANKWTAADAVIIYDDIDIPLGTVRIRNEGSGGTHNGMKNVIDCLGTKEILRVRIGVGDERGQADLRDYVLSKLRGERRATVDKILDRLAEGLAEFLTSCDKDAFMRKYSGVYL